MMEKVSKAFLEAVAKELGNGWIVREWLKSNPMSVLVHPSGAEFSINQDGDKYEIYGLTYYGKYTNGFNYHSKVKHSVGLSVRPTEAQNIVAIAKALQKRLLPDWLPEYERIKQKVLDYDKFTHDTRAISVRLAALCNDTPYVNTPTEGNLYDIRVSYQVNSPDSIELKIDDLTEEEAREIILQRKAKLLVEGFRKGKQC